MDPKTILIVENNAKMQALLRRVVEEYTSPTDDYQIKSFLYADRALNYLPNNKAELIITSHNLIDMEWPQLIEDLNTIKPTPKIMFVSGNPFIKDQVEEFLKQGQIHYFVNEPYNTDEIRKGLEATLNS